VDAWAEVAGPCPIIPTFDPPFDTRVDVVAGARSGLALKGVGLDSAILSRPLLMRITLLNHLGGCRVFV